jgi:hypothetical protein
MKRFDALEFYEGSVSPQPQTTNSNSTNRQVRWNWQYPSRLSKCKETVCEKPASQAGALSPRPEGRHDAPFGGFAGAAFLQLPASAALA